MRKLKLALVLLALLTTGIAIAPDTADACPNPVCTILCVYYSHQTCFQDECCNYTCCNVDDPTCWVPC